MAFRLAHVTDPHFRSFAGARLGDFLGKRAVGALNLLLNRGRKHKMELLARLQSDLRVQAVDHVALTGDLSNVSLPGEFAAARRWIDELGLPSEQVTVVPGNHDAYVPGVVRAGRFEQVFGAFATTDLAGRGGYPFVRLRGAVALVGVNSCVPTNGLGAWGEVGGGQLGRLEALLGEPEVRRRARVVLIHHPPVLQRGLEERNLRDRSALCAVLGRAGADLVLHGHDHRDERARIPRAGDGAAIPVVGAGSASYAGGPDRRARYNIYEIDGRSVTVLTRAHDEAQDAFREVRRERLS